MQPISQYLAPKSCFSGKIPYWQKKKKKNSTSSVHSTFNYELKHSRAIISNPQPRESIMFE